MLCDSGQPGRPEEAAVSMHHACADAQGKLCRGMLRPAPLWAAEEVALVVVEEGAHSTAAHVGRAIAAVEGMDHRICQDHSVSINCSLEVAEEDGASAGVI